MTSAHGRASSLQEDHVPPRAVQLRHTIARANRPKTRALVQGNSGFVLGKDGRLGWSR